MTRSSSNTSLIKKLIKYDNYWIGYHVTSPQVWPQQTRHSLLRNPELYTQLLLNLKIAIWCLSWCPDEEYFAFLLYLLYSILKVSGSYNVVRPLSNGILSKWYHSVLMCHGNILNSVFPVIILLRNLIAKFTFETIHNVTSYS